MTTKRILNIPEILSGALILGAVAMIIYSQWLITRTSDQHKALISLSEIAQREIVLAHLWFEEALAQDKSIDLERDVYQHIDDALDLIAIGLQGGQTDIGELKQVKNNQLRNYLAAVKEKIGDWRKMVEVRLENQKTTGRTGEKLDQEFDAVFRNILGLLQNFSNDLNLFIAQDRKKLKWFNALIILFLIALFASLAVAAFRHRRAIQAKNAELEIRIKERTAQLSRSETRTQAILDNTVDGIITIGERGMVESFNPAAERIFGYKADEVIGQSVNMLMPEPDKSQHDEYIRKYLTTGQAKIIGFGREVTGRRKDGSTFPMDLAINEIRLEDRRMFTSIVRDITERKDMENKLRQLSRAVEQSPASVIITDTQGIIEYVNPKFIRVTGYSSEEVIGKNPRMLKSGEMSSEDYKKMWATIAAGKDWRGEFHNKKKNGELYWESASISPVRDQDGVVTHFIAVKEDITELRAVNEQLIHAEKLNAVGKLTASIAHEFNNPIYGIRNALEQIAERSNLDDTHKELADMAVRECNRVADLIRKLQDFYRPSPTIAGPMDIHQAIDDMILLSGKKFKQRKIKVEKHYAADMPSIEAVADKIKQVVLNLIQNAEEAIPEGGGKITINTEVFNDTIRIRIQDTGCGISPQNMNSIFEPFFTTKTEVKGTGLGLSVSYGIIKSHGGNIQVDSQPGKGTTFTITLPLKRAI